VPEAQVIVLQTATNADWSKGDPVYAVYPDTTSFYPATISQAANKKGYAIVTFSDDSDEFGVTTPKPVPIHHIMAPPVDHRM
jgi:SGF29 tudor-like domain